eukprot:m.104688 g.104688  ORF g.104688 m.104688 type:complete len:730 (-) comp12614_c0_seq4:1134-3323(-)
MSHNLGSGFCWGLACECRRPVVVVEKLTGALAMSTDPLMLTPEPEEGTPLVRGGRARASRRQRTMSGMYVRTQPTVVNQSFGMRDSSVSTSKWYHGEISRQETVDRLTKYGMSDGLFLIRKRGIEHVLCVCGSDRVCNFLIKNKAGGYSIGQDAPLFHSLVDLVDYFKNYQGGLPSVLINECPATAGSSSGYSSAGQVADTETFGEYDAPAGKKRKLTAEEKKKRKQLLARRREQQLQEQLASLPEYTPYWSRGVAALMGVILIVELATAGVDKIAFQSAETTQSLPKNMSSQLYTLTYEPPYNVMIGPSTQSLIRFGAKFGTCMREDERYLVQQARSVQLNADLNLGCCVSTTGGGCGMATEVACNSNAGTFLTGQCTEARCPEPEVRPCCHYSGKCEVTTENWCELSGGVWSTLGTDCGNAQCLSAICGFTVEKNRADQWFRFIIPIFLHSGIIHYAVNMYLQLGLGSQIERTTGTLRMALIYMIAGIGGYVTSAVFSPNIPSVGASGSIFGLIGVAVVDLFQSWQVVEQPWSRAFTTLLHTAGYLMIGTMPFIDNWAHVGGFVFGIMAAIIFLPYLTFGVMDSIRKRCLMCMCIPLLVCTFFVGFMIFYLVQETQSFCPGCKYVQCVPYTSNFCDVSQPSSILSPFLMNRAFSDSFLNSNRMSQDGWTMILHDHGHLKTSVKTRHPTLGCHSIPNSFSIIHSHFFESGEGCRNASSREAAAVDAVR